jgi:hypothetical protein
VRLVADALIQGVQLDARSRERLWQRTARRIRYHQRRNGVARRCHRKTTIRKLHRLGIKLADIPRCDENTS